MRYVTHRAHIGHADTLLVVTVIFFLYQSYNIYATYSALYSQPFLYHIAQNSTICDLLAIFHCMLSSTIGLLYGVSLLKLIRLWVSL